jgi:adenylate cyclase
MREQAVGRIVDIGADPSDSEDIRLQKRMLVTATVLVLFPGAVWSVIYFVLDETIAALIPGGYALLSAINLGIFSVTKRYQAFRANQLIFFLLLPFLLQLVLGGFVGASAVILWALMAPLGALVMQGRQQAVRYMVAYGALLIVSLVAEPSLTIDNKLGPTVVGVFFLLNVLFVSLISFVMLDYFVGQRDRIQDQLAEEQAKTDRLLLNVLPREVAADLKEHGHTKAKKYGSASVLFADLVGFTEFAEQVSPDVMIRTLSDVFTHFDEIADRHGVEKIRTIGDSYMAASGVPVERLDHATAISRTALEMMDYIHGLSDVNFRIGISSGPLVAGVIGTSKFQYDVWGDTVNTASRMESSGEPERIQISEATYRLIGDEFECVPRGLLPVKGKGEMRTWFLEGQRHG